MSRLVPLHAQRACIWHGGHGSISCAGHRERYEKVCPYERVLVLNQLIFNTHLIEELPGVDRVSV